jgi:uncharacterized protein YgiB involved in biofilm formation
MTAVTLTACDSPHTPPDLTGQKIFGSIEQCKLESSAANKGVQGIKDCEEHYRKASLNHLLKSPRYPSEEKCKLGGHEKCTDVTLNGATAWLPTMVGFMENDRPVYLEGLTEKIVEDEDGNYRELTKDELKERNVVAGANDTGSTMIIGGWYPTPLYYSYGFSPSRPVLDDGMGRSYSRSTGTPYVPHTSRAYSGGSRVSAPRSTVVRGGFGGSGRSFGSMGG